MTAPFSRSAWLEGVARIIASEDGEAAANALIAAIGEIVKHEGTCLLAFHAFAPPEVLHHTLEPAAATHYLDRYLAGPYLLDPLYQLAFKEQKPAVCRFRDETPDRFHSSEYYRQYCERTHLSDEVDYLLDVADTTTLALVVARRERAFSKAEIQRLRQVAPIVQASMRAVWARWPGQSGSDEDRLDMHQRLTRCFENFGDGLLTDRERETTQLLLRGFSTKAIARRLDIAPGTVMVHKRNLFGKLGITSQYELFSRFIDALATDSG